MIRRIFAVEWEMTVEADGCYASLNRIVLLVNACTIHRIGNHLQVYTFMAGVHTFAGGFAARSRPLIVMKVKLRIAPCPPMRSFVAHHEFLHPVNLRGQGDTRDMDTHFPRRLTRDW